MSKLVTIEGQQAAVPNPMKSGPYRSVPLAAVILSFAVVAMYWTALPDTIPTHYDLNGVADDYGSKWLLWLLPVINLFLFVVIEKSVQPSWQRFNVPLVEVTEQNAARQQRINVTLAAQVRVVSTVMLAYLSYTFATVAATRRDTLSVGALFGMLALLVAIIGYHVYKSVKEK